jgi:hypothetical protein
MYTPLTLLSQRKLALTARNTLSNLKAGLVPYLGLELTMHALKSQIHLVRLSLFFPTIALPTILI